MSTGCFSLPEIEGDDLKQICGGFFSTAQIFRAIGQGFRQSTPLGPADSRGPADIARDNAAAAAAAARTAQAQAQFNNLRNSNPNLFPAPLTVSVAQLNQNQADANRLMAQRLANAAPAGQPQLRQGR